MHVVTSEPRQTIAGATNAQLATLAVHLRAAVAGQASLEEAAQEYVRTLHGRLGAALARMYVTVPASQLRAPDQEFAENISQKQRGRGLRPRESVLTLLGTYGDEADWCNRMASRGHRAIPLLDSSFVQSLPMLARLFEELGLNLGQLANRRIFAERLLTGAIGLFHADEAAAALDSLGRHVIPDQEFVRRYGVRSVFGMGSAYPDGSLLSCIVFSKETFPRASAERFAQLLTVFTAETTFLYRQGKLFRAS